MIRGIILNFQLILFFQFIGLKTYQKRARLFTTYRAFHQLTVRLPAIAILFFLSHGRQLLAQFFSSLYTKTTLWFVELLSLAIRFVDYPSVLQLILCRVIFHNEPVSILNVYFRLSLFLAFLFEFPACTGTPDIAKIKGVIPSDSILSINYPNTLLTLYL